MPVIKGDRIFVLKCIYQFLEPNRWDVVVFNPPMDPKINYIKRMIGLPGEKVEIIDGDVYINDDLEVDGNIYMDNDLVATQEWVDDQGYGSSSSSSGDITRVGSMLSGDAFADSSADGDWLGLGADGTGSGRIYFDERGSNTDYVNILDAYVGIGDNDPGAQLVVGDDSNRNIVTPNGNKLQPEVTIPAETVTIKIDADGTVTAFDPEGVGASLGTIELYSFANPAGLFSTGHNLYRATDASGEAVNGTPGSEGMGTITQGYLEGSNVDVVQEMVAMITSQRAYEVNSKAIKTADDMLAIVNNISR